MTPDSDNTIVFLRMYAVERSALKIHGRAMGLWAEYSVDRQQYGLKPDGIIGPKTREKLGLAPLR